jgi:heme/copper-type cytochrome/quinol oxidase subunit 2
MVGVVTGCVVFIIIIVFATIIYLKWKRRKRKTTGKNGRIKQIFSHYIAIFDE